MISKPVIWREHGLWYCAVGKSWLAGIGYTMQEAYEHWLGSVVAMGREG